MLNLIVFWENINNIAFAKGGAHLPIAHALRLPETEKYGEGKKKKEEKERKNNAKFSSHYVRPRTHNVRVHALRSHQFKSDHL